MTRRPTLTAGIGDKEDDDAKEVAAKRPRDNDRYKSSAAADKASGSWNSASTSVGDDDYMKELNKEGLKRQQEHMKDTADDEMTKQATKHKIPSYKKGGRVRKTGLALVHKGEKVIPKHKVSPRKKG